MDDKSGYFLSSGVTRSSPVLFTSVPGLITCNLCAVKPSYDYCTSQLRQTAAGQFEASSM